MGTNRVAEMWPDLIIVTRNNEEYVCLCVCVCVCNNIGTRDLKKSVFIETKGANCVLGAPPKNTRWCVINLDQVQVPHN